MFPAADCVFNQPEPVAGLIGPTQEPNKMHTLSLPQNKPFTIIHTTPKN
jgi:hypothetical protein